MKRKNIFKALAGIAIAFTLAGCTNNGTAKTNGKASTLIVNKKSGKVQTDATKANNGIGGITTDQYKELANRTFKNGTYGYEDVNGGKSTLNPNSWKTNKVIYSDLDILNRASKSNTGFLEKRNLANGSLRVRQFVAPTGWHYNHKDGEQLYNRGHLIAYSVSAGIDLDGNYNVNHPSGDQNNPKNLFTQTAYANQQLQTIYERKVRDALKANKKVIYQATAIFNSNDRMARGVNLQAISTDGSLNFNVYIYNVQNGYKFNYSDGSAKKDSSVVVKELPANLQSHYNDNKSSYKASSSSKAYPYRHHNKKRYKKFNNSYYKLYRTHRNRRDEDDDSSY